MRDKFSRGWAPYLVLLLFVLGVGLSIPPLLTNFMAEKVLSAKLESFYIELSARNSDINKVILNEVKRIHFNCGEHDMEILMNLNLYNSRFRAQGIELKNNKGCSTFGNALNILPLDVDKHYSYKLYGYDVGISTTSEHSLLKSAEAKGEAVIFINVDGNFLYWVLNSAWTHEQLQSPCQNCFYVEYLHHEPFESPLFMARGNDKIKRLPPGEALSVSMTSDGITYRMFGGNELISYANRTLWFYSSVFMVVMFVLTMIIFWFRQHRQPTIAELLREGLKNKEFLPYYQPIVNARTGKVIGVEALLRWSHNGELISPTSFIEHAEKYGPILDITEQIIGNIIVDLDKIPSSLWVSVNVVPEQIENGSLFRMLREHRWYYSSRLRFEITERLRISDFNVAASEISKIKAMGYLFKLDDFGTGYGGFSYLQRLGVDEIKIDKMFVDTIGTDDMKKGLLDSIIAFAKEAGMQPVAEGVETQEQVDYLLAKGITHIQGFVYSKPLSVDELVLWLKKTKIGDSSVHD